MTNDTKTDATADTARRAFLKSCGKFAVVTPPTVALLLSTSLDSPAAAASGFNRGGRGDGGGDDCNLFCRIGRAFGRSE